jgi:hypothetical protein
VGITYLIVGGTGVLLLIVFIELSGRGSIEKEYRKKSSLDKLVPMAI